MDNFWEHIIYNNTLRDWTIAFSIAIGLMLVVRLFSYIVIRRVKKIADRTPSHFDNLVIRQIEKSVVPFLYFIAAFIGCRQLALPENINRIVEAVMLVITVFYILRIITASLAFFIQSWSRKKGESGNSKASKGIIFIANGIIWICGFLFLIDNFGFDITTIVAGLGIGGIAIAMASQTVLGDLFNYLAIYFDKPFEQGDFIVLDDKMGVVEYIGIRTTRLRTLGGEQLVCSNTDLTSARVHNYKRMRERRSVFNVGVVYDTPLSKLRSLPGAFRKIIESVPSTRFDRAHFRSFGASSLDFEIVYYILSVEYNEYMDIQQKINLAIFELFEKESVEFAFPTQTIIFQPTEQIQLNHGGH